MRSHCADIKSSAALRDILHVVLVAGNCLNAGSTHGGDAAAFRLRSLLKLTDLRATNKHTRTNLMHYVAQVYTLYHGCKTTDVLKNVFQVFRF